jgi:hypothetical protein
MRLVSVLIFCGLLLASCGGGSGGGTQQNGNRSAALKTAAVSVLTGQNQGKAPLTVAARIVGGYGPLDPRNDTAFSKAELNFGDGTGWIDCTVDLHTLWFKEPTPLVGPLTDWMTKHTYTAAGTFDITGRLTYADGEVIYTDPTDGSTVTVTP